MHSIQTLPCTVHAIMHFVPALEPHLDGLNNKATSSPLKCSMISASSLQGEEVMRTVR